MTIEEMAVFLDLEEGKLDVLRAQEQAGSLPGGFRNLEGYLSSQILLVLNRRWNSLRMERLSVEYNRRRTFDNMSKMLDMLELLVKGLEIEEL